MAPRRAKNTRLTVVASGPVGSDGFASLVADLGPALESQVPEIIVDLSQAQAIDGACLAYLIAATAQMGEGRTLEIATSPTIHHEVTDWRLDTVLTLTEKS